MARIRTIKPEFFRHETLYDAERETGLPLRVAFVGLWTAADREGRFQWKIRQLKLDCLPYDEVDFSRVLDALTTRDFIIRYAVDGREYGCIPSWNQHQVINNRERPSSIPEPNEINTLTRASRVDDACPTALCNALGEGKGREGERIVAVVEAREREPAKPLSEKGGVAPERRAAIDLGLVFLRAAGFTDYGDAPLQWHDVADRAALWIDSGWSESMIIAETRIAMGRRTSPPNTTRFFETIFADVHAKNSRPLPVVNIKPAEIRNVVAPDQSRSTAAAARRIRERLEQDDAEAGSGSGGGSCRLLAQG